MAPQAQHTETRRKHQEIEFRRARISRISEGGAMRRIVDINACERLET